MPINPNPIEEVTRDDVGRAVTFQVAIGAPVEHGYIVGLSMIEGKTFFGETPDGFGKLESIYWMQWGHQPTVFDT